MIDYIQIFEFQSYKGLQEYGNKDQRYKSKKRLEKIENTMQWLQNK